MTRCLDSDRGNNNTACNSYKSSRAGAPYARCIKIRELGRSAMCYAAHQSKPGAQMPARDSRRRLRDTPEPF